MSTEKIATIERATDTRSERDEALDRLRELLHPGDTVYTVLRHVSRSGMSRRIDLYVIVDGRPRWLSGLAAKACGYRLADGVGGRSLHVSGGGMDMGFSVVYGLSQTLWPDGHPCTGDACPSNDHVNDRRGDYTPGRHHADGGYALRQEWL